MNGAGSIVLTRLRKTFEGQAILETLMISEATTSLGRCLHVLCEEKIFLCTESMGGDADE